MGCCGPTPTGAGIAAVDDRKRVNYTLGMLLGVDDFVQESSYLNARRHEVTRELLGWGTARGLQVQLEDTAEGPRVRVAPGVAWSPSGRAVCVGAEQCCTLNGWLAHHREAVTAALAGAASTPVLALHVVLSPAECLTDPVPIPGEPCRSDAELMRESRIAASFALELRLQPPPQREEDAIRDFAAWLLAVPLVPVAPGSPPLTETEFLAQMRDAAAAWLEPSSPPAVPGDFMFGAPPPTLAAAPEMLRAALRLWVTELRPLWRARYGCGPLPLAEGGADDAVLLAELAVPLVATGGGGGAGWEVDDTRTATLDERRRPLLLSLRMVQELLSLGGGQGAQPGTTVQAQTAFGLTSQVGTSAQYARADHSHGTPALSGDAAVVDESGAARVRVEGLRRVPLVATAPTVGQVLTAREVGGVLSWVPASLPAAPPPPVVPTAAAAVTAATAFGLTSQVGTSAQYARADHSHGTPELAGDATVVTESGAARVRVEGLRRVPLVATAPTVGQVLTAREVGGVLSWVPANLPAAPPAANVPVPGTAVTGAGGFGLLAQVGSSTAYARADHSHGTPPMTGDVTSAATAGGATRIAALQGRAVNAPSPAQGEVLQFDGSAWVASPLPGGNSGNDGDFVGRRKGKPFEVVAGGHVALVIGPNLAGSLQLLSSYGELVAAGAALVRGAQAFAELAVQDLPDADGSFRHLVKLTPVWQDNTKNEFSLYLVNNVAAQDPKTLRLTVRLRLGADARPGERYEFHVEISRFRV
jgi:hypothetical protein